MEAIWNAPLEFRLVQILSIINEAALHPLCAIQQSKREIRPLTVVTIMDPLIVQTQWIVVVDTIVTCHLPQGIMNRITSNRQVHTLHIHPLGGQRSHIMDHSILSLRLMHITISLILELLLPQLSAHLIVVLLWGAVTFPKTRGREHRLLFLICLVDIPLCLHLSFQRLIILIWCGVRLQLFT